MAIESRDVSLALIERGYALQQQFWIHWNDYHAVDLTLAGDISMQQGALSPYCHHQDFITQSREKSDFDKKAESLKLHGLSEPMIAKEMADTHLRITFLHHLYWHFEQLKRLCQSAQALKELELEAKDLDKQLKRKRKQFKQQQSKIDKLHIAYNEECDIIEQQLELAQPTTEEINQLELHRVEQHALHHTVLLHHVFPEIIQETFTAVEQLWQELTHHPDKGPSAELIERMDSLRERFFEYRQHFLAEYWHGKHFRERAEYREKFGLFSDAIHDEMVNEHLHMHMVDLLYAVLVEHPCELMKKLKELKEEMENLEKLLQQKREQLIQEQEAHQEAVLQQQQQYQHDLSNNIYSVMLPSLDNNKAEQHYHVPTPTLRPAVGGGRGGRANGGDED